ncbi:MAG: dephospho-CoA kinase [Myxococcales bacterium]|nr:dephospho-CoA kinase [Myxococcales bacterium]
MVTLGLTGGIACGKSTVAAWLTGQGAHLIDADGIARELVEPGTPGLGAVVARFGAGVLQPDGRLDRGKLGARVFQDSAQRSALNAILHPAIAQQVRDDLHRAADARVALAVVDAALLFELGLADACDGIVLVDCELEEQVARLRHRNGLDEAAAWARVRAQAAPTERRARADWVIDNRGSLDKLASEIARVWREVRRRHPFATVAIEG